MLWPCLTAHPFAPARMVARDSPGAPIPGWPDTSPTTPKETGCDRPGETESRGTDQPSGTIGRPGVPARRRQRRAADDHDPDAERLAQPPRPRAPALTPIAP